MLCSPYNRTEPWKVAATLYKGSIYLSEIETEESKKREERMSPREHEMCYWGLKFEDYLTNRGTCRYCFLLFSLLSLSSLSLSLSLSPLLSEKDTYTCIIIKLSEAPPPGKPATPSTPSARTGTVNPNQAFCSVVRTRMSSHSVVMAAEIDCVDPVSHLVICTIQLLDDVQRTIYIIIH